MHRKKLIILAVVFIAYCVLLVSISANYKKDYITQELQADSGNELSANNSTSFVAWENMRVEIQNAKLTDDNPWKTTAGIISTDEYGECIFLTPDTVASIEINQPTENILFGLNIHPWVAKASDGLVVHVGYYDEKDHIISEQNIELDNEIGYEYIAEFQTYERCRHIVFECKSGRNNNSDADWLLIHREYQRKGDSTFTQFGYVKSATYFGDEWPINFWNSEMDHLDADLQKIKDDGFDSIIVCIPWREFQINVDPILYSEYAFKQLDRVMNAAQKINLGVYTRISYTHDFWNDSREYILYRFLDLINDKTTRSAWLEYAGKLFVQLSGYEVFRGGFLTWEDFWGILSICDTKDETERIKYAQSIGYQNWIMNNYQLSEFNKKFKVSYDDYSKIPVPTRNDPMMECMYDYYDDFLNDLLLQAQNEVFPNLSNEVRLDQDPLYERDGSMKSSYKHTATYPCEDSDYTATMYGIPMGFENNGERVTAEDAIQHTEYILKNLGNQNEGKPIYVEQFIFYDNTPQFAHNARLMDEEVDDYLILSADVLRKYTAGYGVWTYRDYYNNMIYNNGFYLNETGWDCEGNVSFEVIDDSMTVHLETGQKISQHIEPIRNHFDSDEYTFSFEVSQCSEGGFLHVMIGDYEKSLEILEPGHYSFVFPKNSSFNLSICSKTGIFNMDNLRMYSHIQNGYLYSPENQELQFIDSVRELNRLLNSHLP